VTDLAPRGVASKHVLTIVVPRTRGERPPRCRRCAEDAWWNGWRVVFIAVATAATIERREVSIPRAKCRSCRGSFTCYPPGIYPRRQYQLDLVADSVAEVVLGGASVAEAARGAACSATSVRRWLAWMAGLAEPAALLAATVRVDPDGAPGAGIASVAAARPSAIDAARVLHALELLGLALVRAAVDGVTAVRSGLARVLHWQHAAHGDVVGLGDPLSPAMALGGEEAGR
jgi:hypothetical protein